MCCGCPPPREPFRLAPGTEPIITWENPFDQPSYLEQVPSRVERRGHRSYAIGGTRGIRVREANELRAEIGRKMLEGINHPDRYPFGTVRFAEAQFVARRVAKFLGAAGHPDNHPVSAIKGLDTTVRDKVVRVALKATRAKLLRMSLLETMDRFGLSHEEAGKLRRAALGLEGPLPDPRHRWDRPGRPPRVKPEQQTLPNVVGRSLEEARSTLKGENL